MEVAVADHARSGGRPAVAQPAQAGREAVQLRPADAPVERGEIALVADHATVEAVAGRPALVVQRAQHRLRVEGVQARLGIGQRRAHPEHPVAEQRPADGALHHEKAGAEGRAVGAGGEHARDGIALRGQRVLDRALPERAQRVVGRVHHAQDQRARPRVGRSAQAEGEDAGVEATADRGGGGGVGEIGRVQLGAEVGEEGGGEVGG